MVALDYYTLTRSPGAQNSYMGGGGGGNVGGSTWPAPSHNVELLRDV